ncbi:SDR family NAD(P)-dependent oxidoreductase [Actinoplanes sp. NPDC051346]|uniref:SDR family NAD(P)-dependent oxidoreductase n=1 Tax=Actinoplanes sp. NPDC051346 TaxID=3155048 RepID=UPI0034243BB6
MSEQLVGEGRTVLVSGASTGLGRACARHLDDLGFRVFAGVRRSADAEALRAASSPRLRTIMLDVTSEESVARATALVSAQVGDRGLWGLVNNAGICVSAPLECVSPAQLRHQLDTNLIGHHAVIQASLPLLRTAHGRIVNVSSGLGRIASPYLGAYAASQFAKEGYSDALRRELRPFDVAVSIVQPGAIRTPIWEKVSEVGHRTLDGAPVEVAELYRASFLRFLEGNDRRARASATRPERFADAVAHAMTARRPKSRYRVGFDSRLTSVLARVLPDRVLDAAFATIVGEAKTSELDHEESHRES